jgi:hypothetical protein
VELNPGAKAPPAQSNAQPVRAADLLRRGAAAFELPSDEPDTFAPPNIGGEKLANTLGAKLTPPAGLALAANELNGKLDGLGQSTLGGAGLLSGLGKDKLGTALEGVGSTPGAGTPELGPVDAPQRANAVTEPEGAAAVEAAYNTGGAQAAAEELDRQTEDLGDDQAAVDALLAEAQPTLEKIAEDTVQDSGSGAEGRTTATIEALSRVADRASDAGVENITGPLAEALPNVWPGPGNYTNPDLPANAYNVLGALENLASQGQGTRLSLSLGAELEELGKPSAQEATDVGFYGISQAENQYTDAKAAREEADAELAAQLAELEGVLSPEEQQAYIDEYHHRHEDVYRAEVEAAQSLNDVVAPNVGLIDQAVLNEPSRAEEVVGVMSTLAGSPLPAAATEWGVNAFQEGSETAEAYKDYRDQVRTDVVEAGLPGTLTQYQSEAGGDPNAALEQWNDLFDGVKNARDLFTNAQQYQQAIDAGEQFLNASRAWLAGDTSALTNLVNSPRALENLTPFGAAFGAAGVAFGLVNAANAESAQELAEAVGNAGKSGLELFAGAVGSLNNSGRLALLAGQAASDAATQAAKFATERLIPGIGLGLNAIATVDAFRQAIDDPSLSNVVAVVGNATAFIGSAISLFPPLAPVGKLIEAIGTAVAWLAETVFGDDDEERNNEQQHILEALWRDHPYFQDNPDQLGIVAGRIADNGPYYDDVQRQADLSDEQLFELIYRAGPDPSGALPELVEVATSVGLEGGDLIDALDQLVEEQGGLDVARAAIAEHLYLLESASPPLTEEQRLERLKSIADVLGLEGPDSLE